MAPDTPQLHGRKEIAASLNVSERSAKRWEKTRGLPVHRVPGRARDAVLAYSHELEAWTRQEDDAAGTSSNAVALDDGATTGAVRGPSGHEAHLLRANWRSAEVWLPLVGLGTVLVLAGVLSYGGSDWPQRSTAVGPAGASAQRTATVLPSVSARRVFVLEVATTNSPPARLGIRDGECGTLAVSGRPPLDLCPALEGHALRLRLPGKGARAGGERRMDLLLEPNSRVMVVAAERFEIEWVQETAPVPGR